MSLLKLKNPIPPTGIMLIVYHIALAVSLPLYFLYFSVPGIGLIITMVALYAISEIGITAGYHRFYSHRAYSLNKFAEAVFLFFGTLAVQGSVLKWCHDHRKHHQFVDTDKDPYSVKDGFWHAHFLWILKKSKEEYDPLIVHDLAKSRLVAFQHKHYVLSAVISNSLVTLLFGWIFSDYAGAFVFVFLARLFITHHSTFFINSIAHYWGVKPYSKEHSAVNNWLIAFFTMGEGYHNYHHTFPSDYRNGIRWYQYDPGKLMIWLMDKIGVAHGLKKADSLAIKKRLVMEDRRLLLEKIKELGSDSLKELESRIISLSDNLSSKINDAGIMLHDYKKMKMEKAKTDMIKAVKSQIKMVKKSMNEDYKLWVRLCDDVLSLKPGALSSKKFNLS